MKWHQKHRGTIVELISLLFIILFTYAGLTKFLEGHLFYDNIRNSPILGGKTMASLASWILPSSELVVALLLSWRKSRIIGFLGATVLMLLFTFYTVGIIFFAPYRPCSCGGIISLLSWEQHLVINAILLLMAVSGTLFSRKHKNEPWN